MKEIIKLENVWKVYKMDEVEVPALCNFNLDVKKGEFLVVMGPSGSGKSTALNLIGSLDLPTKGKIFLDGQDISKLGESELAQLRGKKVGFIFQTFNLINSLTVLENVMLPMTFQDVEKEEKIKRAKYYLERVNLSHRLKHKPGELSGGERQRVAIARALVNNPDVVLADEPTGNLDSKTGIEILDVLDEMHKRDRKTIVVVTHDTNIAKRAERIAHLMDGKIVKYTIRK